VCFKFCMFSLLVITVFSEVTYSVIIMILVAEKQGLLLMIAIDPTVQTDLVIDTL
jgi:hypothetical protein